jgi:hypothetical protein
LVCPASDDSDRGWPSRSSRVKSGAGKGSYSHTSDESSAVLGARDVATAAGGVLASRKGSLRTASLPSSIQTRWLRGSPERICVLPLGQTIVTARTFRLRARPKSSSFECCEMKPEPACTILVTRTWSVSTVTRAPTASRLLRVPLSRTARAALRSA